MEHQPVHGGETLDANDAHSSENPNHAIPTAPFEGMNQVRSACLAKDTSTAANHRPCNRWESFLVDRDISDKGQAGFVSEK